MKNIKTDCLTSESLGCKAVWAAYREPTGLTGYGHSQQQAIDALKRLESPSKPNRIKPSGRLGMAKEYILNMAQDNAAGLIEAMDLAKFYGDQVFESMTPDQLAYAKKAQDDVVEAIRTAKLIAPKETLY